ncbi:MAG: replicative DNA helicase, partial [Gemmatimonadales bacterium]
RGDEGFIRIKEMLWPTMERIETLQRSGKAITGVPSGFVDLDGLTSGFQRAELVVVAARPSMGKTAFCLNIAANAASEGQGVAIFSLEMSKESLVQRMLTATARVDSHRVRQGSLRDSDFTQLARAAGLLQTYQIWIDDTPSITLLEMRSKARRLKIDNDLKLVVVDYLQLMRSPEYSENRVQEISDISRSLKALARELEIPVIALSQLSRASEQRGGERKPILSDLRDSGAIEQDADLVIFIHRPEYYDREDESKRGLAEIMLAKNRNGPTGDVQLKFTREYTRFDSFSGRDEPE